MIQPRIHSERATWVQNRLTQLFIVAGVIGSILSMLVITLDGFVRPGYSPLYQMILVAAIAWHVLTGYRLSALEKP